MRPVWAERGGPGGSALMAGIPKSGRRQADSAKRQSDVRGHNLALVLREVHLRGRVTRAELTDLSGLNRSTIAGLVTDLQGMGLVVDRRPGGGTKAGRPSHLVTARDDGPYTIAVDIDVDRVVVALVGVGGTVLGRAEAELPCAVGPATAVRIVDRTLKRLVAGAPRGSRPSGVGVSVPGTVRREDGVVHAAPNLGWSDVPLAALLSTRLGRRHPGLGVRVGNDADLGARAEHLRGVARGIDDVVYLSGNVGVGGGIIAGGTALPGARGFGGEFGHMVVQLDGPRCRCGGTGCFEALVGSAALYALAGPRYGDGPDGAGRIVAAARAGEPDAARAVQEVAGRLGTGLASVVNLLDPRMIVVGGFLGEVLDLGGDAVDRAMCRHLTPVGRQAVRVCPPGLGHDSSLVGAAELGFDELLDSALGPRWLGLSASGWSPRPNAHGVVTGMPVRTTGARLTG